MRLQPAVEFACRHCLAVEETLRLLAAEPLQDAGLGFGFHAFGNHRHVQVLPQPHNHFGDAGARAGGVDVIDEMPGRFSAGPRSVSAGMTATKTGAEIVDRQ